MQRHGDRIVESPVEARAGFLDRPVLVVLAVSTILAVIVLAMAFGLVKIF